VPSAVTITPTSPIFPAKDAAIEAMGC